MNSPAAHHVVPFWHRLGDISKYPLQSGAITHVLLFTALRLAERIGFARPNGSNTATLQRNEAQRKMENTAGPDQGAIVHVVDDDDAMRAALIRLLRAHGIQARGHAGGEEFLAQFQKETTGCILLDLMMPGMGGIDVQSALRARGGHPPIVFLTGSADVPLAVAAMRAGAFDFLEKPFEDEILLTRVRSAIAASRDQAREIEERRAVLAALERLTPREREVLPLVAKGLTSKEVARLLGASHRTIEIHRANLMQKLEAPTLADLVRADLLIQAALAQHETP